MKYIFITLTLFATAIAISVYQEAIKKDQIPIGNTLPSFQFTTAQGEEATDKDLKNKISIINLFFTSCHGPCPMMSQKMARLYHDFKDVKEVQFISITTDPETDSPAKLDEYAKSYGVNDNRWLFLTGDLESIKNFATKGLMLATTGFPAVHAIRFVLVDEQMRVRDYYNPEDPERLQKLKKDINQLAQK